MGLRGPKARPYSERFWAKVNVGGPAACWPWVGALKASGYGTFNIESRETPDAPVKRGSMTAHRFAYQDTHGTISSDLVVDHLCNRPACCNPAHLEAVSQAENLRRKYQRTPITHCRRGHELTPENTRFNRTAGRHAQGGRACIKCIEANKERKKAARRSVAQQRSPSSPPS